FVPLPSMLQVDGGNSRVVLDTAAGDEADWTFSVLCPARGRFDLGSIHLRFWDRSGMAVYETSQTSPKPISVYPYVAPIRQLPRSRMAISRARTASALSSLEGFCVG